MSLLNLKQIATIIVTHGVEQTGLKADVSG